MSCSIANAIKAAHETQRLELGAGILARTPQLFRELFPGRPALIVADKNTFRVAGESVLQAFKASDLPCREPFLFTDPTLYAEHRFVRQLEHALEGHNAVPVAVGSGTINDLVKLAAHLHARSYLSVATAASMDGYTAFGASITFQGSKQTFSCPAPAGVIADLDVIASAPKEMTAAGYADLLAKITAGADWILADALGAEPISTEAWNIVQGGLREAVADPSALRTGERSALGRLTEGLLLAGFAMQSAQSSRPASGAEHQFSHLWDMQHHTLNGTAPSHGFKVGIGTLAVAALYEQLLEQPLEALDVHTCCSAWETAESLPQIIQTNLGTGELAAKAIEESRAKHISPEQLREQLERLRSFWPGLKQRLKKQLLPFAELRQKLSAAGAPIEPEQIGISRKRLRDSFVQALYIRRRFTVLDLAARAGLLHSSRDALFAPDGPWPLAHTLDAEPLSTHDP